MKRLYNIKLFTKPAHIKNKIFWGNPTFLQCNIASLSFCISSFPLSGVTVYWASSLNPPHTLLFHISWLAGTSIAESKQGSLRQSQ